VTYEQPERNKEASLTQKAIDDAFNKKVRVSNDMTVYTYRPKVQ
jgi:hypothetical protein